jgi:putrescine aminotransferase
MVRGENARIWDSDGNEYIDGTAGLWLCNVGHGRAELAEVARSQMEQLECYASFWAFSNVPSIELAARLAELAPPGLDHVFFTNGGSEGVDTAIKLARLAWNAQGQRDRNIVPPGGAPTTARAGSAPPQPGSSHCARAMCLCPAASST